MKDVQLAEPFEEEKGKTLDDFIAHVVKQGTERPA